MSTELRYCQILKTRIRPWTLTPFIDPQANKAIIARAISEAVPFLLLTNQKADPKAVIKHLDWVTTEYLESLAQAIEPHVLSLEAARDCIACLIGHSDWKTLLRESRSEEEHYQVRVIDRQAVQIEKQEQIQHHNRRFLKNPTSMFGMIDSAIVDRIVSIVLTHQSDANRQALKTNTKLDQEAVKKDVEALMRRLQEDTVIAQLLRELKLTHRVLRFITYSIHAWFFRRILETSHVVVNVKRLPRSFRTKYSKSQPQLFSQ